MLPCFVRQHIVQHKRWGRGIPHKIIAPMPLAQIIVWPCNRVADDLALRRRKESEMLKDFSVHILWNISLMRQCAPHNVARVLRCDLRQHLRTNGRAKTIGTNK